VSLVEMSGIVDPWLAAEPRPTIDASLFRATLSHFPSGVVVITGFDADGVPAGLTCQSFTSLSLDPPLVLIAPAKTSRSWPRIASGHRFAINILGAGHREISGMFARSGGDKFAEIPWRVSAENLPVLDDAIAVIECEIDAVHHGGDHWVVIGAVRAIGTRAGDTDPEPLVFYRSAYRTLRTDSADDGRAAR
jgi:3-hydroxy-9,10-secoandrosta-1,3,5(10)-triene-9,17-dione monooxygenase reductase component